MQSPTIAPSSPHDFPSSNYKFRLVSGVIKSISNFPVSDVRCKVKMTGPGADKSAKTIHITAQQAEQERRFDGYCGGSYSMLQLVFKEPRVLKGTKKIGYVRIPMIALACDFQELREREFNLIDKMGEEICGKNGKPSKVCIVMQCESRGMPPTFLSDAPQSHHPVFRLAAQPLSLTASDSKQDDNYGPGQTSTSAKDLNISEISSEATAQEAGSLSGTLIVTPLAIHDLPKTDTFGRCDPFLEVWLNDSVQRTHVKKKKYDVEYSEEEEERMEFHFLECKKVSGLLVKVLDWNFVSEDKFVGAVCIDLGPYLKNRGEPELLTKSLVNHLSGIEGNCVKGHNGKSTTVTLKLRWEEKRLLGATELGEVTHVLLKATEFENFPKMDMAGTCDPLLEISCGETTYHTKTAWGKYAGSWNEEFVFAVDSLSMDIVLRSYDANTNSFNQLVGLAKFKIKSILQMGEVWIELKTKTGESVLGYNNKTTRVQVSVDEWTPKKKIDFDPNQISPLELTQFVQFLEDERWTFRFRIPKVGNLCCKLWEGIAPDCYVEAMFVNESGKRVSEAMSSSVCKKHGGFPGWTESMTLRVPKNQDIQTLQLLVALKSSSLLSLTRSSDLGLIKVNLFYAYSETKKNPKIELQLQAFVNGFCLLDDHGLPITLTLEPIFTKGQAHFETSRTRLSVSIQEQSESLDKLKELQHQIQDFSRREYELAAFTVAKSKRVKEMQEELQDLRQAIRSQKHQESLTQSLERVSDKIHSDVTDVATGGSQQEILVGMSVSLFFVLLYSLFPRPT